MRKELQNKANERLTFCATVGRFGTKSNYHGYPVDTILFKDVTFAETGEKATHHIWFTVGKRIEDLELKEGDKIQFDARIKNYTKGYVNYREYIDERKIDYKLSNPTKIKLLENA